MKKFLLSSVAVLGLVAAGSASAADLPARKGPVVAPVYAPAFTWTGFYVGANAGYGWGNIDSLALGTLPAFSDPEGFVGGGQIGYNWQMGQFVLGVEADFQGADLSSRIADGFGNTASNELNWFGTVRGRVGFAMDRFMPYITGGFAYANVKSQLSLPGVGFFGSNDSTQYGYTIGAGLEYAFTNNLSAKIEYLYVDLEKERVSTPFGTANIKVGTDFSIVRAGLNYRF